MRALLNLFMWLLVAVFLVTFIVTEVRSDPICMDVARIAYNIAILREAGYPAHQIAEQLTFETPAQLSAFINLLEDIYIGPLADLSAADILISFTTYCNEGATTK